MIRFPLQVTPSRRTHILDGDSNGGGGHRAGTGRTGKTEFPAAWDDDKVIREIESVANDTASASHVQMDGRRRLSGTRDGIDITVVIERGGASIVTGFPTNVPVNP